MAGNSKDSKILAYKDMINQLNKTISTQTELIQSLQKYMVNNSSSRKRYASPKAGTELYLDLVFRQ